jgi:hypothetical protein
MWVAVARRRRSDRTREPLVAARVQEHPQEERMSTEAEVLPRFARSELNPWTLASFAAHAGMLLLFHLLPPRSAALSFSDAAAESRLACFVRLQRTTLPQPVPDWAEPGATSRGESNAARAPARAQGGDRTRTPDPRRGAQRASASATVDSSASTRATALGFRSIIDVLRASEWQGHAAHFNARSAAALDAEAALTALLGGQLGAGREGEGMIGVGR